MEIRPTARGFLRTDFEDANGDECSLQESSACRDEGLIWLGASHAVPRVFTPGVGWADAVIEEPPGGSVLMQGRMHLTQSHVRDLLPALQYFAEHGNLPPGEDQ